MTAVPACPDLYKYEWLKENTSYLLTCLPMTAADLETRGVQFSNQIMAGTSIFLFIVILICCLRFEHYKERRRYALRNGVFAGRQV